MIEKSIWWLCWLVHIEVVLGFGSGSDDNMEEEDDGMEDEDSDLEKGLNRGGAVEADGELQMITECWIECQVGCVADPHPHAFYYKTFRDIPNIVSFLALPSVIFKKMTKSSHVVLMRYTLCQ